MKAEWAEGWFYVGTLYYDTDQYKDAQPAFTQSVKFEDKPAGWAFLGLCEFETGGLCASAGAFGQGAERRASRRKSKGWSAFIRRCC